MRFSDGQALVRVVRVLQKRDGALEGLAGDAIRSLVGDISLKVDVGKLNLVQGVPSREDAGEEADRELLRLSATKKGTDLPDELVIKHRFRHRAVLDVLGQSRAKEVGEATDSVRAVERKRGRVVTFLRRPRSARPVRASQKLNSECSLPPPQSVKTQPKYAVCCQSREQGRCSRIGQ